MIKPASTCLIAYQRVEWHKYMWRHLDLMEVMKERFREGVKEGLSKIRLEGTLRRDCPFTPLLLKMIKMEKVEQKAKMKNTWRKKSAHLMRRRNLMILQIKMKRPTSSK